LPTEINSLVRSPVLKLVSQYEPLRRTTASSQLHRRRQPLQSASFNRRHPECLLGLIPRRWGVFWSRPTPPVGRLGGATPDTLRHGRQRPGSKSSPGVPMNRRKRRHFSPPSLGVGLGVTFVPEITQALPAHGAQCALFGGSPRGVDVRPC